MSLRDEGHASPQCYLSSAGLSDLSISWKKALFLANTIVYLSYDLEDHCVFFLFWSFRCCILDSILWLHKCLVRAYYAGLLDCWHLWPQSPIFDIFWLLILSFQPNPISKAPVCLLACGCLCADLQHFTLHRPWNKMDTVCKPPFLSLTEQSS